MAAPVRVGMRASGALIGLILFCTFWRLPTLGDPPWLNDEGVYATVGKAIGQGEALYRQIWENKPPAIYLLNAAVQELAGAAHALFGVRLAALLAAVVMQVALYRLASLQRGAPVALLAVALAGLLVDLPLLDGTSANAEIFVVACTSPAMALVWCGMSARQRAASADPGTRVRVSLTTHDERMSARQGSALRFVLAGALFGVAVLFKLVAAMDLVAALGIIGVWRTDGARDRRAPLALALLAGVALPLAAVSAWLASRGLLGIAFYATVTYNRGYVATGQTLHGPLIELGALVAPAALILASLWLLRRGVPRPSPEAATCWWLGLALLGALASGRFYLHYFVQAVPPFALALSLLLAALAERRAASRMPGRPGSARDRAQRPPSGEPDARAREGRSLRERSESGGAPAGETPALPGQARPTVDAVSVGRDRALRRWLAGFLIAWTCSIPIVSWIAVHVEPAHASPGSDLVGYYGHVWEHLTGGLSDTAFGNALDPRVERNVAVAAYLRAHPRAPRRLYVWGNAPWIYYLSGYEHAARFLSAYYNPPIPSGMAQVLASLRAQPPPYVVVIEPPTPADAALSAFLAARYRPVWRDENAVIYAD